MKALKIPKEEHAYYLEKLNSRPEEKKKCNSV